MAQFSLPQAVQYDNTANQMLYKMADDLRQQQAYERQLKKEDDARKFNLIQSISPSALSKDYDKQVVNQTIGKLQYDVRSFLAANPNANSQELQAYIQDNVGKISEWSNKVTAIRNNIDEQFKRMEKTDGIDKNGWYAKSLNDALYKNVNGQFVMKSAEELDPAFDWAGETFKKHGDQLVNMDQAGKMLNTIMKEAPLQKKLISSKRRGANGRTIVDETTVEIPAYMEVSKDKDGNDKIQVRKENGYIANDVYEQFAPKGSAMDLYLNNKARMIINQANKGEASRLGLGNVDVEDPGNLELVKRAYLTDYIQKNSPFKYQDKQADMQKSVNVTVKTGADKTVNTIDQYAVFEDAVDNGVKVRKGGKVMGTPLNSLQSGQDYLIELANKVGGKDANGQPKYNQENLILNKTDKGLGIYEWDPTTATVGRLITPIDKTSTDVKANAPLGTKAKNKVVAKTISKADVAKKASAAGYTVEEYTKELEKRGIKII